MKIQLALDRMTVAEGIHLAERVEPYVDWIEVGTSLIKEFGMGSVREFRRRFPDKPIVADVKTFDNARYEFSLCYEAGADVATVMGAAPGVSVEACLETAREYGREVMIDLLNVPAAGVEALARHMEAILCVHLSKDQQELSAARRSFAGLPAGGPGGSPPAGPRLALAGGISAGSLAELGPLRPELLIVGGAITGAADPAAAARALRDAIRAWTEGVPG